MRQAAIKRRVVQMICGREHSHFRVHDVPAIPDSHIMVHPIVLSPILHPSTCLQVLQVLSLLSVKCGRCIPGWIGAREHEQL